MTPDKLAEEAALTALLFGGTTTTDVNIDMDVNRNKKPVSDDLGYDERAGDLLFAIDRSGVEEDEGEDDGAYIEENEDNSGQDDESSDEEEKQQVVSMAGAAWKDDDSDDDSDDSEDSEVVVDGETGFMVPPRDHAAMAAKLIQLLKDQDVEVPLQFQNYR